MVNNQQVNCENYITKQINPKARSKVYVGSELKVHKGGDCKALLVKIKC